MATSEEEGQRNQQYFHRQKLPWFRAVVANLPSLKKEGYTTCHSSFCPSDLMIFV